MASSNYKKRKPSDGLSGVIILVGLDVGFLRMLQTGYAHAEYWLFFIILLFCTGLAIYSYCLNKKSFKRNYRIIQLNENMNSSYDLNDYFRNRDALILELSKLCKIESLINRHNRLSGGAKNVLKEIEANEELHVHTAIIRMSANFKEAIRKKGVGVPELFEQEINTYQNRLSDNNLHDAQICLKIVRDYEAVAGKIEETDQMEGHQFEFWCASLLKKSGFSNVEVTPGSGDQGVDIVAVKDGIHYAIQCKCYSSDLGNTPIQEVFAGKEMYGCQVGAVMTNRYFTSGAKQLAEKTRVLLWDRDYIVSLLEKLSEIDSG